MGIPADARLAEEFLAETLGLILDRPDHLDLKIAAAAITEMRDAFAMFAPYRDAPKVTIFGSARVKNHDPLWEQTRKVAASLADKGWMVITGAGPGIMQAGMEGAGRANSIGVSIRLPFEQGANPIIAGDEKYVSMKYFFTRKLMLVKESRAFVCLPGGFGTLDETFELLTLTQTGKGMPVPIVFLDTPGDDVLGASARVRRAGARQPRPRRPRRHHALPHHQLRRGGGAGDRAVLRQLRLDPLRRREPRDPAARTPRPTSQLAELNERFGHLVAKRRDPTCRAVLDRAPTERSRSSSPGSRSSSPSTATATCGH